jgi:molecular chaperone HscB
MPICQICCRSTHYMKQNIPQRRWTSQSLPSAFPSNEAIKSNPIPKTHYEFFPKTLSSGPPPKGAFHIDARELRREFLQLQAVAHPDRHPSSLKTRAEATSARINEAYKTLQNPLLRAQYLLSLRGIDVAEDETAKVEDPELLMEVLDTREEIENAKEEEELGELKQINDERIDASEKVLDKAFREDDMDTAKAESVKLRYWVNIKESLDGWEKGKPVVLVH